MCAKLLLLWRMKSVCKAFVIVANEECVQLKRRVCAKLLLLWRMKSVCKAFVIVEMKSMCKAFVIVENEECVQSFCNCGE